LFYKEKLQTYCGMENKNLFSKVIKSVIFRIIGYGCLILLTNYIILKDAGVSVQDKFSEYSFVESAQSIYLLVSVIFISCLYYKFKDFKPLLLLIGGFLLVIFIREQDFFLDKIYHGAWLPFALVVTILTLYFVLKKWTRLKENILEFVKTPSFGIIICSLMEIFIFSRLFGNKNVWLSFFNTETFTPLQHAVKNAAEEGSELFGYTLILISLFEFAHYLITKNKQIAIG